MKKLKAGQSWYNSYWKIIKERKIDQSRYLFNNFFGVRELKILDISADEEPDYVADLKYYNIFNSNYFVNQFIYSRNK